MYSNEMMKIQIVVNWLKSIKIAGGITKENEILKIIPTTFNIKDNTK